MFALRQHLYQMKLEGRRSQKYGFCVGAKRVQTSTGPQRTRFHIRPYKAANGNLRQFSASNPHGTMFALRQYLYKKEARGKEGPNIVFVFVEKVYKAPQASKVPDFIYRRIRPPMEICVNSAHPIPTVPCLH